MVGGHSGKARCLSFRIELAEKAGLVNEFFIYVLAYNYIADMGAPILYAILEKNITLFPQSAKAYLTLAEAYSAAGKKELAIPCYEKALALDPGDRNVMKRLQELREKK